MRDFSFKVFDSYVYRFYFLDEFCSIYQLD